MYCFLYNFFCYCAQGVGLNKLIVCDCFENCHPCISLLFDIEAYYFDHQKLVNGGLVPAKFMIHDLREAEQMSNIHGIL